MEIIDFVPQAFNRSLKDYLGLEMIQATGLTFYLIVFRCQLACSFKFAKFLFHYFLVCIILFQNLTNFIVIKLQKFGMHFFCHFFIKLIQINFIELNELNNQALVRTFILGNSKHELIKFLDN